ncbi:hypothetical protein Airi01_096740 [Actinoallomurus iriomotensis]|uniref:Thioesterase domain-containing protein n=1 Tax=Actinoallomurus iriomotensis TaxID=478107 RepID=A0A9W6RWI4_9ACTN|nr:hypothetical protein Airi01_096740 [Actinoallomurus iriomotensis]
MAYHPLVRQLPDDWDVLLLDLPGPSARHGETPSRVRSRVVGGVFGDILKHVDPPYARFGHGVGAIVATEVGRCLAASQRYLVWVGSQAGRHLRLRSTPWYRSRSHGDGHSTACAATGAADASAGTRHFDERLA